MVQPLYVTWAFSIERTTSSSSVGDDVLFCNSLAGSVAGGVAGLFAELQATATQSTMVTMAIIVHAIFAPLCRTAPHCGQVLAVFAISAPQDLHFTSFWLTIITSASIYHKWNKMSLTIFTKRVISMPDGAITFRTDLDNAKLEKDLAKITAENHGGRKETF